MPKFPLGTPCKPDETTMLDLLQELVRLQERQLALQEEQLVWWRRTDGSAKLRQVGDGTFCESVEPCIRQPPQVTFSSNEANGIDWRTPGDDKQETVVPEGHHGPQPLQFATSPQDLQGQTNEQLEIDRKAEGLLVSKASSKPAGGQIGNIDSMGTALTMIDGADVPKPFVASRSSPGPRRAVFTMGQLVAPSEDVIQQVLEDCRDLVGQRWSGLGLDDPAAAPSHSLASVLPLDTPKVVMVLLGISGLLPIATFQGGYARTSFAAYRCYVGASILWTALHLGLQGCVDLQVNPASFPEGILYVVTLSSLFRAWRSLSLLFEPNTGTMNMIIEMSGRGFSWNANRRLARIYLALAVAYTTYDVSWTTFEYFVTSDTPCQLAASSSEDYVFDELCVKIVPVVILTQIPAYFSFFSSMWLLHALCAFHTHEMVWYSGILAKSLDSDDDGLVHMLTQAERMVTARLHSASTSWVSAALVFFFAGGLWLVTALIYIFFGLQALGIRIASAIVVYGCILVAGILPFAKVAEAYEHEVFRRMNLTEYCKKAQPYYGQQFLMHLRSLDWGFRIGGSTINMNFFTRLVTAIALALVTTLLRNGLSRLV
eukprot:TRINITY_DN12254_c0_g1_i1.p1 TRINITY_DN12254_c0_g1~~TRINITY_DN12254_c0_g1_i1.p1  ORF type:complete len:600 (-),score=48.44 TRINITY_DN12254_c0_g1_i1:12-1811(-)